MRLYKKWREQYSKNGWQKGWKVAGVGGASGRSHGQQVTLMTFLFFNSKSTGGFKQEQEVEVG